MNPMLAGTMSALLAAVIIAAVSRDFGYRDGDAAGYKRGRKDEADWWIESEKQVDRAQQDIGREEWR